MRATPFISTDTLNDPGVLLVLALIDKRSVWNALIRILIHYKILFTQTQYLSRNRTLETIKLRAIATARRLCGN